MTGECYFCHGLVLADESDHLVLSDHGDHQVYLHEQCAAGQNVLEVPGGSGERTITCPECGTVEVH